MRLKLVVKIEGEGARWERDVERPYPGVPRAREWVYLGDGDAGEGLMATPIAVVTWENDGGVALRFDVGAGGPDTIRFLEALGFTRA
jgi:hypothetical protein